MWTHTKMQQPDTCLCHLCSLSLQEENYGNIFMALDQIFLSLYVMEILLKWYHDFLGFWKVGWNVFDFVIVAASLLGPSEYANVGQLLICVYLSRVTIYIYIYPEMLSSLWHHGGILFID